MFYQDHIDSIVIYYKQKKEKGELSQRFQNPSPAKLRDECIEVCGMRSKKNDLSALRIFLGVRKDEDINDKVNHAQISKFKPLVNFLNRSTTTANDKTIELLGWLIDFPLRPFQSQNDYGTYLNSVRQPDHTAGTTEEAEALPEEVIKLAGEADLAETGQVVQVMPDKIFNSPTGRVRSNKIRKAMTILAGLLVLAIVFYCGRYFYKSNPREAAIEIPVRITQTDTITEKHIGKLWYQKRGADTLDYYTAGGKDPVNPDRDLHRLTKYIFNRYLRK